MSGQRSPARSALVPYRVGDVIEHDCLGQPRVIGVVERDEDVREDGRGAGFSGVVLSVDEEALLNLEQGISRLCPRGSWGYLYIAHLLIPRPRLGWSYDDTVLRVIRRGTLREFRAWRAAYRNPAPEPDLEALTAMLRECTARMDAFLARARVASSCPDSGEAQADLQQEVDSCTSFQRG